VQLTVTLAAPLSALGLVSSKPNARELVASSFTVTVKVPVDWSHAAFGSRKALIAESEKSRVMLLEVVSAPVSPVRIMLEPTFKAWLKNNDAEISLAEPCRSVS